MDLGNLNLSSKPIPPGIYRAKHRSTKFQEAKEDKDPRVMLIWTSLTDNPHVEESTIGKDIIDSIPWTPAFVWRLQQAYCAITGTPRDMAPEDISPEAFAEAFEDKEVVVEVIHNIVDGDHGPRPMANVKSYQPITEE